MWSHIPRSMCQVHRAGKLFQQMSKSEFYPTDQFALTILSLQLPAKNVTLNIKPKKMKSFLGEHCCVVYCGMPS